MTPTSEPTKGRIVAGYILVVFGLAMLLVALIAYAGLLMGLVTFTMAVGPVSAAMWLPLLAVFVASLLIHAMGQAMIFTGDYMQGKFREMSGADILWQGMFYVFRDLLFVTAGYAMLVGVLGSGKLGVLVFVGGLVVSGVCYYYGRMMRRKIDDLEPWR